MDYISLGRTGIEVSVAGLGAGGPSRIGKSLGKEAKESVDVVRKAFDLGITFYDSAESYDTEELVGRGLSEVPARAVCISTKLSCKIDGTIKTADELEASLDGSLKRLKRDWIDIYHLHGVIPAEYGEIRDRLYPILVQMRDKGKIRHIGITEMFGKDTGHEMLGMAVEDDLWDVIMVGFSAINFSARPLLEKARARGVGVLDMFAVRKALRDLDSIQERIPRFAAEGDIDPAAAERERPFSFAIESGICDTVAELSYRFCRHEPGIDVVLTGTGSTAHLEENVKAIAGRPLPPEAVRRIEAVFDGVDTLSGGS